ncbi:MAG: hypothetical protein SF182_26160 [Deltaproteobacteria bacterium]|nr:hypothetical protein [Deltaproteobacteria bacterium]
MRSSAALVAVATLVALAASPVAAQLAPAIQYVLDNNLASFNKRDLNATMNTIDTRSPDYASTKAALEEQFKELDVTASLVKFTLIGHDDEFVVARASIRTAAKPGTKDFVDNTIDAILLFHMEGGAWKLWDETILGVTTE